MLQNEDGRLVAKVKFGKYKRAYLDMMVKHFNLYEENKKSGAAGPFVVHYVYPQDEHL